MSSLCMKWILSVEKNAFSLFQFVDEIESYTTFVVFQADFLFSRDKT